MGPVVPGEILDILRRHKGELSEKCGVQNLKPKFEAVLAQFPK